MVTFSSEVWVLIAVVGAACTLGCLNVLAAYYREHTRLHDLRVRIVHLRREYAERVAKMHAVIEVGEDGEAVGGVDVLPDSSAGGKQAA